MIEASSEKDRTLTGILKGSSWGGAEMGKESKTDRLVSELKK